MGLGPDLAGAAAGGRKLVAVVYADMAGYSRLIGLDVVDTLRRLRTLRRTVVDPAIREYGGSLVQTGGDSLLAAFDSIEGAVRFAVALQRQVPMLDGEQPAERRMRFRVGISIGDVIADGSDLHGEGVNIAARLEAVCPEGCICVSQMVRDHLHGRPDLAFDSIGSLTLKNIARPVEGFVLRVNSGSFAPFANGGKSSSEQLTRHIRRMWSAGSAMLLVCIAGAGIWWFTRGPPPMPKVAQTSQPSQPVAVHSVAPGLGLSNAPRLSLVVLPFTKFGDGVDDNVVDGITEDLTTDLARLQGVLVIARNSAFTYKGKPIDIKRVGQELGVRYAVEGSVRNVEGKLRVNVQFLSTETGEHLWAERFDIARDGIGYDVDNIVRQVAFLLQVKLADAEAARSMRERPANPDVADILTRARAVYNRPWSPERQTELLTLYGRAVELEPSSAGALGGLAEALVDSVGIWSEDPTAPAKLRRAEELITRAELIRPDERKVMLARLLLLSQQNRCPELIAVAQRTHQAHPGLSSPHFLQGICLLRDGRAAEAIPSFEQSIRVHPRNPNIDSRYLLIGYATLFLGRYDEAVSWFQKSLAGNPGKGAQARGNNYAGIAAAQALAGDIPAARVSAAEAVRLWPTLTARSYFPFHITNPVTVAQVSRMRDGLRLAGIRDHADEAADPGLPPDDILHTNYEGPTPIAVPGAQTIRTAELAVLIEKHKPLILDTTPWGSSIPGAIGLWGAGIGGSLSDEYQDRLRVKMQHLTDGDRSVPVVAVGWNAERFQGRNLALRLAALGYTDVYWYRGGREAWAVADLPMAEVEMQDW